MIQFLVTLIVCVIVFTNSAKVPIYVMLPLDTISPDGDIPQAEQLSIWFDRLSSIGVDGLMIDVWWGITEPKPLLYKFEAYDRLLKMITGKGMTVQLVTSWHQCGGNVGDTCNIPLPSWVLSNGLFYTDQHGNINKEYLSLSSDTKQLFPSQDKSKVRTAIDCYSDWMKALRSNLASHFDSGLISTLEIGLGPAGELRYPSYPSKFWKFPGVGEFQSYDSGMFENLRDYARNMSHPEWSLRAGPSNAGTYNSKPDQTGFFSASGFDNWKSSYGKFFLTWYSNQLLNHADRVLGTARQIFNNSTKNPSLAAKVAGIHWWYKNPSHAAELTAGYYQQQDGYIKIASLFASHQVEFQFTCLEMTDASQAGCACGSSPEELVRETRRAAREVAHTRYAGENALPTFSNDGYNQIMKQSKWIDSSGQVQVINGFTYLRLGEQLMNNSDNWNRFANFVGKMHNLN